MLIIKNVSGKKPPKSQRGLWINGWYWELEPKAVGKDPQTDQTIYFGDGVEILCQIEDNPNLPKNFPF